MNGPLHLTFDDGGPDNPALRDEAGLIVGDIYGAAWGNRIALSVNACLGATDKQLLSWVTPPEGSSGLPQGPWPQHLLALSALLIRAESFISGFEDDPLQEGIPELLAEIRGLLRPSNGATPS